ncbi:hypothetical protein HDE_12106 [Halotydeus destructor]|nr:hypothetical protein HDE_12106 [Halotydeus destructor]
MESFETSDCKKEKQGLSYFLGYQEHVYTYDHDFRNRPCKDYENGRKHAIDECLRKEKRTEEECNEKFKLKDCSMTSFKPLQHGRHWHGAMTVKFSLLLQPTRSETTMIPKTSFSEFVTLLTGIIGFWLGFNLITFHGVSKLLIKTLRREAAQPLGQLKQ